MYCFDLTLIWSPAPPLFDPDTTLAACGLYRRLFFACDFSEGFVDARQARFKG
jgi:hypothetical protein